MLAILEDLAAKKNRPYEKVNVATIHGKKC